MAKVLIVDDSVDLLRILETALRHSGHDVRAAANREQADAIAPDFYPDVLVVDWNLGDHVDGIELTQRLRARLPQLPAILITGYPSEALKTDAAAARIWPVLTKPLEWAELKGAIEEAMTRGADSQPS
jgi:two-component system response regulator HydG